MVNNVVVQVEEMARNISKLSIEIHELRNALLKVTSQERERQEPSTEKVQKEVTNKMSTTTSHACKEEAKKDGDEGEKDGRQSRGLLKVCGGSAEEREREPPDRRSASARSLAEAEGGRFR